MASLDDDELLALLRSETEASAPAQHALQPTAPLPPAWQQHHASAEDDDLQLLLDAGDPLRVEDSCNRNEPLAAVAPPEANRIGCKGYEKTHARSGATTAQLRATAATGHSGLAGSTQQQQGQQQQRQTEQPEHSTAQQQPHKQPQKQPDTGDVMDEWDPMAELDMFLEEEQAQQQQPGQPNHSHQQPPMSKAPAAARSVPADELADLFMDLEDMQAEQQQQQQGQPNQHQRPAASKAPAAAARLAPDDELADLMMDLDDMRAAQAGPHQGATAGAGAHGGAAAAATPADLGVDILDLGAELDFYDDMQEQLEEEQQQQQGRGLPSAKRPRHGSVGLDLDLDLELATGAEGGEDAAQQQQQQLLLHKPGTLSTLTGKTSRAGIAQAAAAALTVAGAACPPKKTLLGVGLGKALPVTTQDGTRVYCSVSKQSMAPAGAAGALQSSSSGRGARPVGCLLGQPITAMMQTLDTRRREVSMHINVLDGVSGA